MLLVLLMAWPRIGVAAPTSTSASEARAADAMKAYQEGVEREREGKREAAEHYYRAAAEANAAAFTAVEGTSADDRLKRETYAGRTMKAYAAARRVFDNPTLHRSAGEWCTRWAAEPDIASSTNFTALQEACKQWPAPPVAPTPTLKTVADPQQPNVEPEPEPEPGPDERGVPEPTEGSGSTVVEPEGSPEPSKPRLDKRKRGLMIGGGVALGIGGGSLLVSLVGAARQVAVERSYTRSNCEYVYSAHCPGLFAQGERLESMTVATLVMGSVFVVTGAVLMAVATRRKPTNVAFAPTVSLHSFGLGLRGRF